MASYKMTIPKYTVKKDGVYGYMLEDCKEFIRQVCELNAFKFKDKEKFSNTIRRWMREKEFVFFGRNGKPYDMFDHYKRNLFFVRELVDLYYDVYKGKGFGKIYLDAIYRPNPEKFVLAVRDAMSNTDSDSVADTVKKIHKFINGIRYIVGAVGGAEYKKMMVLYSDTIGGTGKTFFATGLLNFLNSLSINSKMTTISEKFNNFDTATEMFCVVDEFRYPRSEDSELGFLNRVIDKSPTDYERKCANKVTLKPKAQLMGTTTERPKHSNNRRYDIIKYNYNPVIAGVYDTIKKEVEGFIPKDEAHLNDIILRLFAYCPPADYSFPVVGDGKVRYEGIHAPFLFEIQEVMQPDNIFSKATPMDLTKYLYYNNSSISSSYTFPLFKNKMNQLITDLHAKCFIKYITKRGCAAHHYYYNLNDLLSIPVGMDVSNADIEYENPAKKTFIKFQDYLGLVHESANSNLEDDFDELKDIYNKILDGELRPDDAKTKPKLTGGIFDKNRNVDDVSLDKQKQLLNKREQEQQNKDKRIEGNINSIDDLIKDDNLILSLEKEDEPIVSLDELIDEIELEETDVKLTENDIRNVLLMPECATLTTPPVYHHADNNQFWVSARLNNKCLVRYVKEVRAGIENPIFDRKAENLIPTAFVYESDGLDLNSQKRIVKKLLESDFKNNVLSVTYSGNKSIHILIKIRNEQGEALKNNFKFVWGLVGEYIFGDDIKYMDKACASVGRLTRLPGAINLTTGKKQLCYYLNPKAEGLWLNLDVVKELIEERERANKKQNATIEKKENKTYDNDIDGQFRAICNKSKNSSAQIALDILESRYAPQGDDLIFAVKYVANLVKYNPKFHSIGQELVDICHGQHPSNIVYKTIDEYIE